MRRAPLAIVAAALLLASGSQATNRRDSAMSSAALNAANTLMAQPWTGSNGNNGLAAQFKGQTLDSIAGLSGDKAVDYDKNGLRLKATLQNVTGSVNFSSPPGFSAESPSGFTLEAPLSGGWGFAVAGKAHVEATACCTPAHQNWFGVKGDLPFSLSVSNIHLTVSAQLNASDAAHPTLTSASVHATATISGTGFLGSTPINLTSQIANGTLTLTGQIVNVGLSPAPGNSAKLNGTFSITFQPSQVQAELKAGSIVDLGAVFQKAIVGLQGQASVTLPQPIGKRGVSIGFSFPAYIPSFSELNQALQLLQPPIPRRWPPADVPDRADAHAQPVGLGAADFAVPRDALETGIASHIPYGAVLSIDYKNSPAGKNSAPGKDSASGYTYGLDADSTIWTGHYLAAEAFRYAATGSPDALARVKTLVGGIQRDFDVTRDAVVDNGKTVPVQGSFAGIFARSALPDNDPHGYTDGRYDKRGSCYYEHPSGGWQAGGRTYPTLAAAEFAVKAKALTPVPLGAISYAFGCGSRGDQDHPISRDQYVGLFMGLTYAYALVPATDVRAQIQSLIDQALHYVLNNNWNVPLPPDGTITTSFIGDFDAQLALLRMGATVDPAAFSGAYKSAAAASELVWIPTWLSSIDPLVSYYKFNLGHAALGPALFLETDPTLRTNYLRAYRILAAPTALDRNAYFDLVDILAGAASASSVSASNPRLTLAGEVKSDLADWITRWQAVKGPNDMPRNATSKAAADYLAQLWQGKTTGPNVRLYTATTGNRGWFATHPVPLWARPGDGMDFVWQRSPYGSGVGAPLPLRTACTTTPPSSAQLQICSAQATREGPGVDYLLPYWLGEYLKVLPT